MTDVFETMQVYLGSLYVNDFNRFGRTYQVYAQAEADARAQPMRSGGFRSAMPKAIWSRLPRWSRPPPAPVSTV
jgi:hypothetical protein